MVSRPLFDYDPKALQKARTKEKSTLQQVKERFDPRRLASTLMIEFHNTTNECIDIDEYAKRYELKYDKIICFVYNDLPFLKPFYFTANAGQLLLLKDFDGKPNTIIESDLNTLMNVLYGNVGVAKARKDGRILIHGEKFGHDEALFFEIFQKVAPLIRAKLKSKIH